MMSRENVRRKEVGRLISGPLVLIRLGYSDGSASWAVEDPSRGLAIFGRNIHGAKVYIRGLVREFGIPKKSS